MSTIPELAKQLSDALVTDKRNNGEEFVHLADNSPQWMTDVIRAVHGDKLPDDTTYSFIERSANALAESDVTFADHACEVITEIEPDSYTHDLTAWLHARADHTYWLTEVLEETDIKDGFQLLALAQQKHIQEVGYRLVQELEKLAE